MVAPKISFCTTVMNRLHHLQKTLPQNIVDNNDYYNVEWVILDYNSTDGLEDWYKSNANVLGNNVRYFRTTEPQHYKRSHSRNMAFRLSTGDILVNLDADNYAGRSFARYISKMMQNHPGSYLAADENISADVSGKVCVARDHFFAVGGYDETVESYGFEDFDLKERLEKYGVKRLTFENTEFLKAISHSIHERIKNEYLYKNLEKLYIEKISPEKARLIFITKDGKYESARILDTQMQYEGKAVKPLNQKFRYIIEDDSIEKGLFSTGILHNSVEIINQKTIHNIIYFYSQLQSKPLIQKKNDVKDYAVNINGFGNGKIMKAFETQNPPIAI